MEGSTKLGPTNMNHIEQGIDAVTDTAEAAVPKSTVTTAGDLIYATNASAVSRLGIGTARQVLATNPGQTAPQWIPSPTSVLTGTGDLLYSSAANTLARLAAGTNGQVLTMVTGLPAWASAAGITLAKYSRTSEKDVNTTTTKTDLFGGSITVGANAMSSSGAILLFGGGDLKNASGSGHSITLELKLGSQVLWDSNASKVIANDPDDRGWTFWCVIQSMAATNAQSGFGEFTLGANSITATTGVGGIDDSPILVAPFRTAATTVDMTSAQTLTLSVTLGASSASFRMRLGSASALVY